MTEVYTNAIELFLSAIYSHRGETKNSHMSSFMFGPIGAHDFEKRISTTIWARNTEMVKAALFLREHGAPYLRDLPMGTIHRKILKFIEQNYAYISKDTFLSRSKLSYAAQASTSAKRAMANAIASSEFFAPSNITSIYPLTPFVVEDDFSSADFFLVKPATLSSEVPQIDATRASQFPPFRKWEGKNSTPNSWLGVRSPTPETADKLKSAILGSLALLPHKKQRFMFTQRKLVTGICIVDRSISMRSSPSHTPALSDDIIVGSADHNWLHQLASMFASQDLEIRRQLSALRYFYRAWGRDPTERFPFLVMAIEALYSKEGSSTGSVVHGVSEAMDDSFSESRLRLLLGKLRASVIHGRAPDIYDANEYYPYFERWESDPIYDLELIAARCLQKTIFKGGISERPHPYADLLRDRTGINIDDY